MQKAHKAYVTKISPSQIDTWAMPNNSNKRFLQKDSTLGLLTFCFALSRKIINPTPKSIENKPIILNSKNTEEITITIQSSKFLAPYVEWLNKAVIGKPNDITFIKSIPRTAKPLMKSRFVILVDDGWIDLMLFFFRVAFIKHPEDCVS